ncbi:MAG: aliphatic sulfonate ABC transporter substrate-binding protein [Eubacteriales bacterium]|nr:aliphatic sulfonate ABC transporter substrate-binding protein [Eubacteriales bacterium]
MSNNKKKTTTALILSAVLLAAAVLSGCGGSSNADTAAASAGSAAAESTAAAAAENAQVRIAIQPSAAFVPLFVAKENGWIEEALAEKGVEVVWNDFESGPPMNESLAAGSSDIGVIGDVPTVSAIAAGQDNLVAATTAKAADSYAILVPADSEVSSAADLSGKKIATVIGSTGHNLVRKFLEKEGLSLADVELVNISAGDAAAVLTSGEVDAVAIWEPNVTRITGSGAAKIIAEGSDVGLAGTNTMVVRKEYAEANGEVLQVILEQYARGAKELENIDEETLAGVAEYLSLETEQLKQVIAKFQYTVIPDQEDIDSLNDTIEFLGNIDAISETYDITDRVVSDYADTDAVKAYLQ